MKGFVKAAAFAGLLVATGAQAADLSGPVSMGGYKDDVPYSWWNAGDIFVRLRGEAVIPQTSTNNWKVFGVPVSGPDTPISTSGIPELDISYFLTKNIAIEAICCVSQHQIEGTGAISSFGKVGDVWLFPPTVLLQYHFDMGQFKPYVGAGVNYTVFFDESSGPNYTGLKLNNAWGAVVQAGADYHLSGNWFANFDFKKLWLDTDASVNLLGAIPVSAHVNLDPIIAGAGIGYRFGTDYTPLK